MSVASENHLDTRLITVEKEVVGIKADVSYIRSSIDSISASQTAAMTATRTNWGMLATWAGVILSIAIYHGNLTMAPVEHAVQQGANERVLLWGRNDRAEQWHANQETRIAVLEALAAIFKDDINTHEKLFERVENRLNERYVKPSDSAVPGG